MRGYSECGIMLRGSTKQIAWSDSVSMVAKGSPCVGFLNS
jgi:hypothetical protein